MIIPSSWPLPIGVHKINKQPGVCVSIASKLWQDLFYYLTRSDKTPQIWRKHLDISEILLAWTLTIKEGVQEVSSTRASQ